MTSSYEVLAKYTSQITDAIRGDLQSREFLELCEARGGAAGA